MLEPFSFLELAVAVIMLFIGSTVISTVGFGIGMSTTPILLLFFDPQTIVVVLNSVSLVILSLIIYQVRPHLPVVEMAKISASGALAVPIGVFFLITAGGTPLRLSITALIMAVTIFVILGAKINFPKTRYSELVIGFIVSLMLTTLGVGGPLMVLFLLSKTRSRQTMRGALALYFMAVDATAVLGYVLAGLLTQERIILILVVTLPVLAGFVLGTFFVRRLNEEIFRSLVLSVIMITSMMVLVKEIVSM